MKDVKEGSNVKCSEGRKEVKMVVVVAAETVAVMVAGEQTWW